MLKNIILFEIWLRARKISTYLYFILFIVFGLLAVSRASIGHGFLAKLTNAGIGNINANSPFAIHYLIVLLTNYGLLITALMFGNAAFRDFKQNTSGLYFSYPISKTNYIAGRFIGAFIVTLFIFSGIGIGAFLGSIIPFYNLEKIGSINLLIYIYPYLISVIPNILFSGALFFSLVLLARKFIPVYLGVIIMLLAYLIGLSFHQSQQNYFIASLCDPFGLISIKSIYTYWMAAQKNNMLIPFTGNFIINRVIWTAAAFMILFFSIKKFKFSHNIESGKKNIEKPESSINNRVSTGFVIKNTLFENVSRVFNFKNYLKQVVFITMNELKILLKNNYFLIILILGIIFISILGFRNVGLVRGAQTFPLTSQILATTQTTLYLFNLIIIFFTSAELIWKERNKNVNQILDVLPIPEWISFIGKLGTLILIQVLLMAIIMVCGILIQVFYGFYDFEIMLYIKELFGIRFPYYVLISVFALFIQVLINKKFLGYIVTLLLIDDFLPALGLDHHLWRFGSAPTFIYSDINGYGHFVKPLIYFNLYWVFFAILLIILSILFLVRGNESNFKERIVKIKDRITRAQIWSGALGFTGCLIIGIFIIYNTNFLNEFTTDKQKEKKMATYEKIYNKYENKLQPKITDIKINVDIYPHKRKAISSGRLILENKTGSVINELIIQLPEKGKLDSFNLNVDFSIIKDDPEHTIKILTLNNSLNPGGKIEVNFGVTIEEKGFKNHDYNTNLVQNGTFLYYFQLIPAIGYDPLYSKELEDNDIRKNYNLHVKENMAASTDKNEIMNNILGSDGDWINYEAIVSTSKNQTALTSGELLEKWQQGDRNYFHYKSDGKILKYFPFISAKYSVKKEKWNNVGIEVYYYEKHHYNIELMIKAVKNSLEYYTENFGPYQFKQLKIVEFPKYELYAEAFPDIITHSEGYGFTAKYDSSKVNYVYRVTAHEVGHQWWAHQVVPANVEGAFFLGETMTQYSALMVSKKEYGKQKIRNYMKKRIDTYLQGRGRETKKELPLIKSNIDLWYMNYEKGIVVMNALQDYIGEEKLNTELKRYVNEVKFQNPPYTTSLELVEHFRNATPDSLQYLITDMFETITLYDNKATSATYKKMDNGKYLVNIEIEVKKFNADEIGNEKSVAINDYISFGVFGKEGKELYQKKHLISDSIENLQFVVNEKPEKAGIDPNYLLIDKNTNDNFTEISEE